VHPPTHANSKNMSGSQQSTATNTQAIIYNRHTSHARDQQLRQKSVEKLRQKSVNKIQSRSKNDSIRVNSKTNIYIFYT
jgi:hypothetical protein